MSTQGRLVLVYDDNAVFADLILRSIRAKGINCVTVNNSEDFWMNYNPTVDICVIDHNLGTRVTGLDIIEQIRKNDLFTAIIFMTSSEDVRLFEDANLLGATALYKCRPEFIQRLLFVIEATLHRKQVWIDQRNNFNKIQELIP